MLIGSFTSSSQTSSVYAQRIKKVAAAGASQIPIAQLKKGKKKSFFERVLVPFSENLSKVLGKYTPANMIQEANKLLEEAGMGHVITGVQLTSFCWILAVILPVAFSLYIEYAKPNISPMMRLGGYPISLMLGFRLPMIIIAGKSKKRKEQIVKSLPFAMDLLSISVQAGMGFEGAISIVSERLPGPLGEELQRALSEIRLGKPRTRALLDLGVRTGVEELRRFSNAIAFVTEMGGNLSQILPVQAEGMRIARRQAAEEQAMKAPVKMMIPLVLFIFPAIGIVIMTPAAISMMENL